MSVSSKRRVKARLPKLYGANGNINKKWFIYYYYLNPETDKLDRFKIYMSLNGFSTKKERYQYAKELISEYTRKLKAGWSPFDDEDIIYESLTNYHNSSVSKLKIGNFTIEHFFNKVLKEQSHQLRQKSIQTYNSHLRGFLAYLEKQNLQNIDIDAIDHKIASDFLKYLIIHKSLSNTGMHTWSLTPFIFYTYR